MRDPQGNVKIYKDIVIRELFEELPSQHFLNTIKAKELERDGLIIEYELSKNRRSIKSKKIKFITYPYEWCDQQIYDAALLTLNISEEINKQGFELKDASAWNILFDGCRPIFCDHMSFQHKKNGGWDALGQFLNHFIFPLALSRYVNIFSYETFLISRNGATLKKILNLLRFKIIYSRLLIVSINYEKTKIQSNRNIKINRANLLAATRWLLFGVKTKDKNSKWFNYTNQRKHYSESALKSKKIFIEELILKLKPQCTVDFGCNSGEYSFIAKKYSDMVIAVDSDHDVIQKLYKQSASTYNIYPLIADLTDFQGGRGWAGTESIGLNKRLCGVADLLMMLAITHHLSITESISFDDIFSFAASVTTKNIIVELIEPQDEIVEKLINNVGRHLNEFSLEKQIISLSNYFEIIEIKRIDKTHRFLVYGKKKLD